MIILNRIVGWVLIVANLYPIYRLLNYIFGEPVSYNIPFTTTLIEIIFILFSIVVAIQSFNKHDKTSFAVSIIFLILTIVNNFAIVVAIGL